MFKKNYLSICSIYVGTVIGAGFASGQEIISFLLKYGFNGIIGIFMCVFLFSFFGNSILKLVKINNINSYEEILKLFFGNNITLIFDFIILFFLITGFCVMCAGSGAIFYERFNISKDFGILIMCSSCLLIFLFNIKGLEIINNIVVPILILGISFIGISILLKCNFDISFLNDIPTNYKGNFIVSSISYVCYNMIPSLVILSSLKSLIKNERDSIKSSLLSGILLGILAFFVFISCAYYYQDIKNLEVPMLYISTKVGINTIYFFILWLAMFTTAVSNGFGFIHRMSLYINMDFKLVSIVFCFLCIFLSKLGFSTIIQIMYPIFGYIGFFILLSASFKFKSKIKKR